MRRQGVLQAEGHHRQRRLVPRILIALAVLVISVTAVPPVSGDSRSGHIKDRYLVELRAGSSGARHAHELARRYGGRATLVYDSVIQGFAFAGSRGQAARLARDPRVAYVEPDSVVRFADDPDARATHLDVVNARAAYPSYGGDGVRVAVLDSGISRKHTVFAEHDNFMGWHGRCVGSKNGNDRAGHGTAVASSAVGSIGVAHLAKVYAVKIFPGASTSTSWSRVVCGLNHVRKWNAKNPGQEISVVNMSIAGQGSRALKRAAKRLVNSGVVVVAAAGNNGGRVQFPARYNFVVGVTALNANGTKMAPWSSGGKGADLTAPGARIFLAKKKKGFVRSSGTSFSAPQVAGAAAVVLGADPAADPIAVLKEAGRCPGGGIKGADACPGRWKGDDKHAEPLIDVHCAALTADPLALVPGPCQPPP